MLCSHFRVFNTNEMQKIAWCINLPGEKQKLCGETFAREVFSILRPPPFKESVPRRRSLKIENGKKEVRQTLLVLRLTGRIRISSPKQHLKLGSKTLNWSYYQLCGVDLYGIANGNLWAIEAKQPVHWFLGGKGLGIQQGMGVWIGSSKSCPRILVAAYEAYLSL